MVTDDQELWGRVLEGDGEAFGELFQRHAPAVFGYCLRRTGEWAVAEDLVSVVFLETWRKRTDVVTQGSVLPWLYSVALGVTRNHRRAQHRYRAALTRVPAPFPHTDHADEVTQQVDAERRTKDVIRELSRLPRRDREVVEMCAWSGLTQSEIAQALGIPLGTVKSRLARAQRTLRGVLAAERS